ncbi:MAG: bile acid:sodium symporter family protein [Lawsonella sp.]
MKKNLLQRVTQRIDWLIVGLLVAILLASLLPARGDFATAVGWISKVFLFLLFFVYGAKLAPSETLTGLRNWKLHVTITTFTFVVFPLFGVALRYATEPLFGQGLALGILYLTLVPSTVQSSIAFTSVAHGNVAGAIVSASFSNILGVFLTPLLVALTMATTGDVHISGSMVLNIVVQILLPFILGQLLHKYIGGWIVRHPLINKTIDRGTIWLIVYSSFSDAVVGGVWKQVTGIHLLEVVLISVALVSLVLVLTWLVSGWLNFPRRDRIAIQFCGSKKSLSTGVAMGSVLFAGVASLNIGMLLLPLMIFHLFQLLLCAVLASRYGRKWEAAHATA